MKKNTMKYRLTERKEGQAIHRDRDVNTLYQSCIRCQWQKIPGQPYQAKALDVELNLSILRAVTVAEFMVESFYSRARRENRRIAGYVTVSTTQLSDKMAEQKSAIVAARSINCKIQYLTKSMTKMMTEIIWNNNDVFVRT
jgi:hypothetical protein